MSELTMTTRVTDIRIIEAASVQWLVKPCLPSGGSDMLYVALLRSSTGAFVAALTWDDTVSMQENTTRIKDEIFYSTILAVARAYRAEMSEASS